MTPGATARITIPAEPSMQVDTRDVFGDPA
jgi:hypothetical protein